MRISVQLHIATGLRWLYYITPSSKKAKIFATNDITELARQVATALVTSHSNVTVFRREKKEHQKRKKRERKKIITYLLSLSQSDHVRGRS